MMRLYLSICIFLTCMTYHVYGLPGRLVTKDPALKGHSIIGPDPSFTCPTRGVFPHPTLCDYYYECWGSVAQLGYCTENQLYDLNYDGCNWPEYVDCGNRIRPTGLPTTVTPPITQPTRPTEEPPVGNFTCPTPGGAYPYVGACEYYWLCYESVATLTLCSNDYLFDLRYSGCNFDFLTACQDRPRPPWANSTITPPDWTTTPISTGPTVSPTTTRPSGFVCPAPDGSFADPADCQSFYMCVGGHVVGHQTCPDNLLWNDRIKNCDFPWNVDCPNV